MAAMFNVTVCGGKNALNWHIILRKVSTGNAIQHFVFVFVHFGICKHNKNCLSIEISSNQVSSKSSTKLQTCLRNCVISSVYFYILHIILYQLYLI